MSQGIYEYLSSVLLVIRCAFLGEHSCLGTPAHGTHPVNAYFSFCKLLHTRMDGWPQTPTDLLLLLAGGSRRGHGIQYDCVCQQNVLEGEQRAVKSWLHATLLDCACHLTRLVCCGEQCTALGRCAKPTNEGQETFAHYRSSGCNQNAFT